MFKRTLLFLTTKSTNRCFANGNTARIVNKNLDFVIRRNASNGSAPRIKVEIIYKNIDKSKYNVLLNENKNSQERINEKKPDRVIDQSTIDEILQFYEYTKYMSGCVPSDLSVSQMSDLISMQSEKQRESFLRYLCVTESRKLKDKLKKKAKHEQNEQLLAERPERQFGVWKQDGTLNYALWGNTLFTRIDSKCLSHIRTESKLRNAALFGQKLILDLDYDDHMSLSEARIQTRHIVTSMVDNLKYVEPFDIYFTNCDYRKTTMATLSEKYFHSTPFAQLSVKEHFLEGSYLDHFDKDRLVYLTPDAPKSMSTYCHDDIYIVGAFLDKSCLSKPASHLKATREGIRQYRLPLDKHVLWGSGSSKHLCINHMVGILNSLKMGADWKTALYGNIPQRKVKSLDVQLKEEELRRIAYIKRKLAIEKSNNNNRKNQATNK